MEGATFSEGATAEFRNLKKEEYDASKKAERFNAVLTGSELMREHKLKLVEK